MQLKQVKVGDIDNFAYVLKDETTGKGAIVDPGFEADRLVAEAEAMGAEVTHVLVTHGHWDHVDAVPDVKAATNAEVVAHEASPVDADERVSDGETLRIGDMEVRVVHTPGHQPDSVCYIAGGHVFTGDTLFVGECGRTDLPGSDPEAMWDSLNNRIPKLDKDLVVCPGHDYGKTPTSTIGRELEENYTLKPRSKEEFVRFMQEP